MFAHAVQRHIKTEAEASKYFSLTADITTDTSGCEQFSCTLQFVDDNLVAQNVFLGFYSPPDLRLQSSFSCIKDVFTRLSLILEKLPGYCFDKRPSFLVNPAKVNSVAF